MRTIVILAALIALAPSAHGQLASDIVGGWQWQSTTTSDGSIESPGTIGYSVQVQFSADGTFLRYHDNSLVEQSVWDISYVWVLINGGMVHLELVSTALGDQWDPVMVFPAAVLELRNSAGGTELYSFLGPVSNKAMTWGSVKTLFRE